MNATTVQLTPTKHMEHERDAIRACWSRDERERRRQLARDKQRLLADLLLLTGEAVETRAA